MFSFRFKQKFIVAILVMEITIGLCLAQGPPPPPAGGSTSAQPFRVDTLYFSKEDKTTIAVLDLGIWKEQGDSLWMNVQFNIKGKKIVTPETAQIFFVLFSNQELLSGNDNLEIQTGGKTLVFQQAQTIKRPPAESGTHLVEYSIPYASFLDLVKSQKVKMKIGRLEFNWTKVHQDAMQALISKVEK